MTRLFGTDGVRGVANTELTAQLAYNLGFYGARALSGVKRRKPKLLIGKDTRISGDMLEAAIVAGICASGADALIAGVVPTPAIAYLTALYGADAGAVISASHNSYEFNGIKFFDEGGYKLPDSVEDEIERMISTGMGTVAGTIADAAVGDNAAIPTGGAIGRRYDMPESRRKYLERLLEGVGDEGCDLSGTRIALDCANGAVSQIAPELFRKLGADVCAIHCEPNGVNINDGCGSTCPEAIRTYTIECGADIGFTFDGDADRMLAVDEKGRLLDGDAIMAILAIDMKSRGELKNDTVAATVMSNFGMESAIKKHGIRLVRTAVGDRYVLEEMVKNGYVLGGENSGHIICLDANTTGDGLYAAIRLSKILLADGGGGSGQRRPVSHSTGFIQTVPQIILNAKVSNDKKSQYLDDPVIRRRCEELEAVFDGEGRVLIRPSGTEPVIRVMIESNDKELMETEAEGLTRLLESRLR